MKGGNENRKGGGIEGWREGVKEKGREAGKMGEGKGRE